jgi:glycosyltransferase involved in cell wall biosynthesis
MNTKGLISAVLPTFNRCDFLRVRLPEILAQTYENWELIVVNDYSTDGTFEFLNSINDPRVKVINLPLNSGCVSIPRAVGISQSNGEFIAPIDDDVVNLVDKFEHLVSGFDEYTVLCYGNRQDFRNGVLSPEIYNPHWNPTLPNGWGVDNGQLMYKASVYHTIPITFPKRGCDWELAKTIYRLGKFKHINRLVSIYQWHSSNRSLDSSTLTKKIFPSKFQEFFDKKRFFYDIQDG